MSSLNIQPMNVAIFAQNCAGPDEKYDSSFLGCVNPTSRVKTPSCHRVLANCEAKRFSLISLGCSLSMGASSGVCLK